MGIDRLSFGFRVFAKYGVLKKWRVTDVILCLILFGVNIPIYLAKPFQRQFTVNDLTILHPYAEHQRVGDWELIAYSFVIPFGVILLLSLVLSDSRHRFYIMYISLLGLFLSYLSNMLITNYLKNWIGRCRPDFIARCQPREGLQNDVLYTADVCTTANEDRLMDGFRTTPSGHSSQSFAGLGYLFLWLSGQLLTEKPLVGSWRKAVAFIPVMGAAIIALSRTQDYRHHFVDVILGSLLGMWFAWWAYRRNFPPIDSRVPFKPLLDNSDVELESEELPPKSVDEEMAPLTLPPTR
ncbi:bifunctional diacylglycerol diphosphate phosphatase/phosphatidate phosphatase Ecym_3174 [Eremothecium cymbalariae DBVPG|uniref:Phosphatidic acid phosphatase type 2/haloperoxidase domain-containing protein n=1 Tax=Eremothecium cymbalariae (strain CBS 270.75 / DBVPG 7215 / KCTC 17166 / NRRL Y-17582) TaxID=931890 RepID=G8JRA6_ERECY|nr:Hypothetical protein Ecym_3174 [Eremothecium cymbalariae DBVPG\